MNFWNEKFLSVGLRWKHDMKISEIRLILFHLKILWNFIAEIRP